MARRIGVSDHQPNGGVKRSRGARSLLVVAFCVVVCLAFWSNSGRNIEQLKYENRFEDGTGLLSPSEISALKEMIARIDRDYGVAVYFKASRLPLSSSEAKAETIFVGVCPSGRQLLLVVPPAWEVALGSDFRAQLHADLVPYFFEDSGWGSNALFLLQLLEDRMNELKQGSSESD